MDTAARRKDILLVDGVRPVFHAGVLRIPADLMLC
jgi:hypothetical protein